MPQLTGLYTENKDGKNQNSYIRVAVRRTADPSLESCWAWEAAYNS